MEIPEWFDASRGFHESTLLASSPWLRGHCGGLLAPRTWADEDPQVKGVPGQWCENSKEMSQVGNQHENRRLGLLDGWRMLWSWDP